MNAVREYRIPLLIAGGSPGRRPPALGRPDLAPELEAVAASRPRRRTLQSQQTSLQAKLTSLQSEHRSCRPTAPTCRRSATQIPSGPEPDRRRRRGVVSSRASSTPWPPARASPSPSSAGSLRPPRPQATPATAAAGDHRHARRRRRRARPHWPCTGNYGQITSLHQRARQLPPPVRDPEVRTWPTAPPPARPASQSSSGSAARRRRRPTPGRPCGSGGTPTAAAAGPYNLAITGSIYYTSTPNALAACTKATAAVH